MVNILFFILGISVSFGVLSEQLTTPGSYAVTMKWKEAGEYRVRTAIYSFREDMSFRADYWEWSQSIPIQHGDAKVIGGGVFPQENDKWKFLQTSQDFLGNENTMITKYGSYVIFGGNTKIRIDWNDGRREYWKRTWKDNTLNKIELYYISQADKNRDTYLYFDQSINTFSRNNDATNAGFAFGSRKGFNSTGISIQKFNKDYKGVMSRWNGYNENKSIKCTIPEVPGNDSGTYSVSLNIGSKFQLTDNNVWRYVNVKTGVNAFHYLARPDYNPGLTSRRVVIQVDHDWDNDGHISDSKGHTYYGLQIIDRSGLPRGFVFSDATWSKECNNNRIMSSIFYLDKYNDDVLKGIE